LAENTLLSPVLLLTVAATFSDVAAPRVVSEFAETDFAHNGQLHASSVNAAVCMDNKYRRQ